MKELKSFVLEADSGKVYVNGEEVKNVTEFSLVFKDGEFGLKMGYEEFYSSNVKSKKFLLDLFPSEISKD